MTDYSRTSIPSRIENWWLSECLGSGFSGAIYKATHLYTRQVVALKLQDKDEACPTNRYERYFYPILQGGLGMPTLWGSGVDGRWDWLAIDLLGTSLDRLYRQSGKNVMDLRSVCCLAQQIIARLEFMHDKGILHRDIQLGNCVVGPAPHEQTIYMIDFGFSKQYIDPRTKRHIPDSNKPRDFLGNYYFTSVNVHCRGKVPSRRDDLEAVALMMIHLLTPGGLSWVRNGVPKTDHAHTRLKREKQRASPEDLCRGLPSEFEEFLRYCRRLKFAERPDYTRWISEFKELAVSHGFPESDAFVWPPPATPSVHVERNPRMSLPLQVRAEDKDLENAVGALANLALGSRQILGERDVNENTPRTAEGAAAKPKPSNPKDDAVVVVSSDSENEQPLTPAIGARMPKAVHLASLARKVPSTTDNAALSKLVLEFWQVFVSSRSRALTKEGFSFLDALYKQLSDPSVYVVPMRTSRSRGQQHTENAEVLDRAAKMNELLKLRIDVGKASNNKALAKMVADFGSVIDKSNGRTLTKDALGFLEGLAARLRTLE
ncbi:CK1/CK1 protein kinase [Cristinia sonorae]|uniref:CK1/CK1 protein kinase n=1 Tax=Cristinia sonorae TaxID=1940300 RepID=A0A8K0UVD9_9AGAR|nr:CK1/CK1 protein kinase [Cristinia sonorae]